MTTKVWYIAAGKKKAGPMTSARLRKRVGQGKVPAGAMAWREGMNDWEPIEGIERFQASEEPSEAEVAHKERSSSKRSRNKVRKANASAAEASSEEIARPAPRKLQKTTKRKEEVDATVALGLVPLYRLERKDMWRAFGMGLEGGRIKLALVATLLPALGVGAVGGLGLLAAKLHALLAVPFLGVAGVVGYVLLTVAMGALSYHGRCQLLELERPGIKEALRFAWGRAASLSLPPFLLSIAWIVPVIALVILGLMVKIPYVGPLGTGLLFGVHMVLGASVIFLLAAAAIAGAFGPVMIAFEETGVVATMKLVLGFVRSSLARTGIWGALPTLAMGPFAGLLLFLAVLVLALPLLVVFGACGPDTVMWIQGGAVGPAPHAMLFPMLLGIGAWVGLVFTALGSILASVQNALCSLLYLGGREGNDDQISHDTYLALRAGQEG